MDEATKKNTARAGVVVLVVAVAWFALKGDGGGSCKLASAGVGLVVAAMLDGKTAGQIAGTTISGVLIPGACEAAIDSFIETPDEPVTIAVDLPAGTSTVTTSGAELVNPDPQPDLAELIRRVKCRRFELEVLYAWCLEGKIPPPAS